MLKNLQHINFGAFFVKEFKVVTKFLIIGAVMYFAIPNTKITVYENFQIDESRFRGYGIVYTVDYPMTCRTYRFVVEKDPRWFPLNKGQMAKLAAFRNGRPDLDKVDDIALALDLFTTYPDEYGDMFIDLKKVVLIQEDINTALFREKIPLIFLLFYVCYVIGSLIVAFMSEKTWRIRIDE